MLVVDVAVALHITHVDIVVVLYLHQGEVVAECGEGRLGHTSGLVVELKVKHWGFRNLTQLGERNLYLMGWVSRPLGREASLGLFLLDCLGETSIHLDKGIVDDGQESFGKGIHRRDCGILLATYVGGKNSLISYFFRLLSRGSKHLPELVLEDLLSDLLDSSLIRVKDSAADRVFIPSQVSLIGFLSGDFLLGPDDVLLEGNQVPSIENYLGHGFS